MGLDSHVVFPFLLILSLEKKLFYLDEAIDAKETVLFLHGLGAISQSWYFQFDALKKSGYRSIAPDLPGFGESDYRGISWNFNRVIHELRDLLDSLGINRFNLVGISMGGAIALKMALQEPERIKNLALVSTFATLRPGSVSEWGYFLRRSYKVLTQSPRAQAELVADRVFPGQDKMAYHDYLVETISEANPFVYRRALLAIAGFNQTRKLAQLKMPVLVISGQDDSTIPVKAQRKLAAAIPQSRHVIIPDGGHAINVDQPEQFNAELLRFLDANQDN